jgi:CRISPR associated protein Cas2 family
MRNTFLVCYDICDDKRLPTVHRTMRDFCDHLQYSIFACQFTPTNLARCRFALGESTIVKTRCVAAGALTMGLPQDPEAHRAPRLALARDSRSLLDEERSER